MDFQQQASDIFDQGYRKIKVTMKTGDIKVKRLFSHSGTICVFKDGATTRGYEITPYLTSQWTSIKAHGRNTEETVYEWFLKNLGRYRKAFTERLHPNLWSEYRTSYEMLSIDAFKAYVDGSQTDKNSRTALYEAFTEYCKLFNIENVIHENRYRNQPITSLKPDGYSNRSEYNACVQYLKGHLDNKRDFHYAWRSSYDVTVSGKMCQDGIYRAWLSLEYRGAGNGHYYVLINEKAGVFSEDD